MSRRPPCRSEWYPVNVFCPFSVMQIGPPACAVLLPRFTFQALSSTYPPVSSALAEARAMGTSWVFCRYTPNPVLWSTLLQTMLLGQPVTPPIPSYSRHPPLNTPLSLQPSPL